LKYRSVALVFELYLSHTEEELEKNMRSPSNPYRHSIAFILILAGLLASVPQRVKCQGAPGDVLVPKSVRFSLELLSPLSTATNQKGDKFSCKVLSPVEYTGAIIGGYIRKAKRSGKAKGKSEMDLAFETITFADGNTATFNASVVEVFDVVDAGEQGRADNEGTVKAKSTIKRDMLKIGAGAAIGAILGGIFGGAQGAAVGAAIGAGIGVSTTLATKGPDLEFKQGTQFTVITNAPSRRREAVAVETPQTKEAPARPILKTEVLPETPAASGGGAVTNTAASVAPSPEVETTHALPPLPTVKPTPPRAPSSRVRAYKAGNLFSLSVPANWRESSITNPVTFAPDGGYLMHQGQSLLTHGAIIGNLPLQSQDLRQASEQFISVLLQRNSYLQKQGDYQSGTVANHAALTVNLSGQSNLSGYMEVVTVHMMLLRNGFLFYVVTVAPQDESSSYQGAFQTILRSLQITDQN
jgi:hypothetical protein